MENYELLDRIGEGTFGEVHRAKDRRTGRLVALKRIRLRGADEGCEYSMSTQWCILGELTSSCGFLVCHAALPNSALREMRALKQLRHPHVRPKAT